MEDLKRDFTVMGERFMQFMQGTVDKMKDFEMPFGDPVIFEEQFVKEDADIHMISLLILQMVKLKYFLRKNSMHMLLSK